MKAVQFSRFGPGSEVAEVINLPEPPPPGPGEVAIEMLAAPINPSDLLNFEGRYGATPPALPAFAGGEAVARVAALGAGVTHLAVGDRVLALTGGRGNWRERALMKADALFPLPRTADTLQLAMLAVNPATAWHMLTRFVSLEPGDWVLQNAGTSGVGQNVITLAREMGARTVSVVRRGDQVERLRATGADAVVIAGPDLPARVAEATAGGAIKLALDAVAGDATGELVSCLANGGVAVIYGLLSGNASHFNAADLLFRDVSLRGFWFSVWFQTAPIEEKRRLYDKLTDLVANGTISIAVEATYPLPRVREALAHAARGGRNGKILLRMNED